jgi:8-oxo-dGTP diphosphatase
MGAEKTWAPVAERTVAEIDWPRWQPHDRATLVFVLRGEEILLIRKKRGLGAGKINGPGGRLDPGESAAACAVREVEEELHVTPAALEPAGQLLFQFVDGYALHVEVFRAREHRGEARETDEAVPLWTPIDAVPFDEMWADDRLWFPHLLAGRPFRGYFTFDGDTLLDYLLEVPFAAEIPPAEPFHRVDASPGPDS